MARFYVVVDDRDIENLQEEHEQLSGEPGDSIVAQILENHMGIGEVAVIPTKMLGPTGIQKLIKELEKDRAVTKNVTTGALYYGNMIYALKFVLAPEEGNERDPGKDRLLGKYRKDYVEFPETA